MIYKIASGELTWTRRQQMLLIIRASRACAKRFRRCTMRLRGEKVKQTGRWMMIVQKSACLASWRTGVKGRPLLRSPFFSPSSVEGGLAFSDAPRQLPSSRT
jgi:hypothetical protein